MTSLRVTRFKYYGVIFYIMGCLNALIQKASGRLSFHLLEGTLRAQHRQLISGGRTGKPASNNPGAKPQRGSLPFSSLATSRLPKFILSLVASPFLCGV